MAGNNTYHQGAWLAYSYEGYRAERSKAQKNTTLKCSCCLRIPEWGVWRQVTTRGSGVFLCAECNNLYAAHPHTITLTGGMEVVQGNNQLTLL